jgi:hypothetical protein
MSSDPAMPAVNALVDLLHEEMHYLSRVEDVEGPTIWVAAPLGGKVEPPDLGTPISFRWNAPRGRYTVQARLRSTARPQGQALHLWNLKAEGPPTLEQRRQYVRAGGGEGVVLEPRATGELTGMVTDISEGGVRCRFRYGRLLPGEPVEVRVTLGGESLAVDGWVLRTTDEDGSLDVIVVYELGERDADMVRKYVMHQQILARRMAADTAR